MSNANVNFGCLTIKLSMAVFLMLIKSSRKTFFSSFIIYYDYYVEDLKILIYTVVKLEYDKFFARHSEVSCQI